MKRTYATILVFLVFLAFAAEAAAYVYMTCGDKKVKWSGNTVSFRAAPVSFPSNNPYTFSLTSAVAAWNLNPSNFKFLLVLGASTSDAIGDGQNEIAIVDDASLVGDDRAVTFRQIDCDKAEIVEADVLFNLNQPWTPSTLKRFITTYGGDKVSFEGVAEHELGHVVGLQHEDRTFNIMLTWAQFHTNGAYADTYPGEDASNGAVFLYGVDPGRPQDLGVSHLKFQADAGLLARTAVFDHEPTTAHNWTEMMDLVDGFVSWRDFTSEPRFIVFNGQQIWPEFTYENNGSDTQTVRIGFYLSDDDYISTSDRRIGGAFVTLGRDTVYTRTFPVALPADLPEDRDYYLGVIIDDDNKVAEPFRESNATYTGLRTGKVRPVSLSFNPKYVPNGGTTIGTITLNGVAPAGGVQMDIHHDYPVTIVTPVSPTTVTVPAGSRSVSFTVKAGTAGRPGDGYDPLNMTASSHHTADTVSGLFYLKMLESYRLDRLFCEAHPEMTFCVFCKTNPARPLCNSILGSSQESEYMRAVHILNDDKTGKIDGNSGNAYPSYYEKSEKR